MSSAIIIFLTLALDAQVTAIPSSDSNLLRPAPPPSLKGWTVQTPDSIDWDGSGYSSDDWYARIEKGHLIVNDQPDEETGALPFKIKPIAKRGGFDLAGDRHVAAVENGYIVGFDSGEFGGGAWWFSSKGTRRRKLTLRASASLADYIPENVHALAVLGKDILAFEGLTHLMSNEGRVVRLRRGSDGEWHASLFTKLEACPHAVLEERPGSWLLATTAGIFRIDEGAHVRPIWQPRGGHLYYANSLVRDDAGVVYMGMRSFVVRMRPQPSDTYFVDVLASPKGRQTGVGK